MCLRFVIIFVGICDCYRVARTRRIHRLSLQTVQNVARQYDRVALSTTEPIINDLIAGATVADSNATTVTWLQDSKPMALIDRAVSHPVMDEKPEMDEALSPQLSLRVMIACGSWHAFFACIIAVMLVLKFSGQHVASKQKLVSWEDSKGGLPPRADEGEESDTVQRSMSFSNEVQLSSRSRNILKIFVLGSGFFTTLNCTIFMPDSTEIAENAGGGLILSGFLLGAYGLGGICGGFIIRSLTHLNVQLSFQFVCLCMLVGNAIAVLSLLFPKELPWDLIVFLSRVGAGMELGLEYTNHALILGVLNPTRNESMLTAMFSYMRLFQYAGAAMGPAVAMACSSLGSTLGVHPAMPALLCMCCFALVFGGLTFTCFPAVPPPVEEAPSAEESGKCKQEVAPGQQMEACATVIAFNVLTFLRHGMRLAMEAGSLIILEHSYGFSHTNSGYLVTAVMLVTIPSSFLVGRILESKMISNHRLVQVLELLEIIAAFGLFSFFGQGRLGVALFICSSGLFYGVNSTVSNPLSAMYYSSAIKGHRYLSKDKLIIASTTAIQLGMAAGPIASRVLSAWSGVGQNALGFIVLSNLIWQFVCCRVLVSTGK